MSDTKDLSLALQTQANHDNDPNVTDKVCAEIKDSVIFQYNWEDLLQSAPVAISSAGACYAACFSDAGNRIQLQPPTSGSFKYLNDTSLSACLVVCGDLGRFAFMEAEVGLMFVKSASGIASNKVADIIDCISDPPTAKKLLKPQMSQLKAQADDCLDKATKIDKKFEDWLLYTCELHAACVGTESSTEEKLTATNIGLQVEQTRFDSQKNTVADAKAASDKLGKQLDVASEAFKKASDDFPSGWDILGQQVVGSLVDCATTALSQGIAAFTSNMNPMAKASTGMGLFGDLIHGGKNTGSNAPEGPAPTPPPPVKDPRPPYSQDAAYSNIQKDMTYLNALHVLLTTGPGNGVDWDSASGDSDVGDASKGIQYVSQMLADAQSTFSGLASGDPPSNDLNDILSVCSQVAAAIVTEAKNGTKLSNTFPAADSTTVKEWQSRFQTQYTKAQKMVAIAKAMPGSAAGGIPLMANSTDPAVQIAQTNAKTAQAQATLEAAKNRLSTTQDTFMKTQELYAKNTALLLEQENKLTEVQAELTKLNQSKIGLTEIKAILLSCIKLIVNVKQQIMNLCSFFKAISASIEAVVQYSVQPFLDQVAADVSTDGDTKNLKIGDYTFSDLQRSMLYSAAVTVRSHFSVFGDIAGMWATLSTTYIKPGLNIMDELSIMDNDPAKRQKKVADLQAWATASSDGVKKIAADAQKNILDNMASRVDQVQSVTKALPPAPEIKKAIEAGTTEVKNAAEDAIVANNAAKPLNRFAPKRV